MEWERGRPQFRGIIHPGSWGVSSDWCMANHLKHSFSFLSTLHEWNMVPSPSLFLAIYPCHCGKPISPPTSSTYTHYTYSGAKTYLVSHQLCKFSHLKRREACNFHHRYTSTMTDKTRRKNPENHIVGFLMNLFANYGGK